MGMEYQKIHAYPNECILYRRVCGHKKLSKCGLWRYKIKDGDKENTDEVIKHDVKSFVLSCHQMAPI